MNRYRKINKWSTGIVNKILLSISDYKIRVNVQVRTVRLHISAQHKRELGKENYPLEKM